MGKAEYIVMGAWAVQAKTGKVRHRPCRRWCQYWNEDDKPTHLCDQDTYGEEIPIPPMVITASECLRNKNESTENEPSK